MGWDFAWLFGCSHDPHPGHLQGLRTATARQKQNFSIDDHTVAINKYENPNYVYEEFLRVVDRPLNSQITLKHHLLPPSLNPIPIQKINLALALSFAPKSRITNGAGIPKTNPINAIVLFPHP